MIMHKTTWLLAGLLCLALWLAYAWGQGGHWQSYMDAALAAHVDGDYAEAQKPFEAAVKSAESFGPEDPRLATSHNGLAEVYRAQGRYAEAESHHKRALAIREKTLGENHPDVATSLSGLALVYRAQGKYAEAEPLYQRSLAIWEKALGPEHPHVATGLNNLATLYYARGKWAEAEVVS